MKKTKLKRIALVVLALLVAAMPLFGFSEYTLRVVIMCFIYALLAASLNLISGVAGQVSMGHAAFYAVGAYSSALTVMRLGFPFWLGLVCAALFAAVLAFLIGLPVLRLTGGYLAVITLGFSEVVRLISINWISLTNGNIGLTNIPNPVYFGMTLDTNGKYFYYALIVLVISLIVLNNIEKSKFGKNLRAINCDEISAEALGINVHMNKLAAFTISGLFAGVAGALYAHLMMYIDPKAFTSDVSTGVLAMVVLGGMGSLTGSVITAFILTIIPEALRSLATYRMLFYGLILIAAMLSKAIRINRGGGRGLWDGVKAIFHKPEAGATTSQKTE